MSILSEFMVRGAQRGKERASSRGQSTSPGRVVVLKGWTKGMDKLAVTLLMRDNGVPLAQAHSVTNSILRDETVRVSFPDDVDVRAIRRELKQSGVIL
jgi:hypothetical protein